MVWTLMLVLMIQLVQSQDPCNVFHEASCPMEQTNLVCLQSADYYNNITFAEVGFIVTSSTAQCQDSCSVDSSECHYWTHFLDTDYCYHHLACAEDSLTHCDHCISGPTQPPVNT